LQTLIVFCSSSRAYIKWLESGQPDDRPSNVPFTVPAAAGKGDRYLLFVGGRDQVYVGTGKVVSDWQAGKGAWRGKSQIFAQDKFFREPRRAKYVVDASGFRPPTVAGVVPADEASLLWSIVNGKKIDPLKRAIEGAATESRSRTRNSGLRIAALERAKGRCEGCGTNFHRKAGGLGRSCLVVHHKRQLRDTDQPRETELSELAVVCANCHMMIHSNPDRALTIAQLRRRLNRRP